MNIEELEYLEDITYKIFLYEEFPIKRIFKGITKARYKRCKKVIEEYKAKYDLPDFVWDHCFLQLTRLDIIDGRMSSIEEEAYFLDREITEMLEDEEPLTEKEKREYIDGKVIVRLMERRAERNKNF